LKKILFCPNLSIYPFWGTVLSLCIFYFSIISAEAQHSSLATTLIIYNAKIWTGDRKNPEAEAIAIRNHEILMVGTTKQVLKLADEKTKIIDLFSHRMIPGFMDGHIHFFSPGSEPQPAVDLASAKSEEDFAQRVGDAVSKLPQGKWFTAASWKYDRWKVPRMPNRKILDKYTPDNPVYLVGSAGHFAMVNSAALQIAGVNENTPDPAGGQIVRYVGTRIPTGVLKNNAMDLVNAHVKLKHLAQDKQYANALKKLHRAASLGITGVSDNLDDIASIKIYNDLLNNRQLSVRLHIYRRIKYLDDWLKAGLQLNTGNRFIRFCGIKAQTDGAPGSSSAYFYDEYNDSPGNRGLLLEDLSADGDLENKVRYCINHSIQFMAHAIGDRAIHETLDMLERAGGSHCADYRFRMEHVQHPRPADIKRFGQLGIVVSVQPNSVVADAAFAEKRLGSKRCETTYPFRDFLDGGAILAFGSDGDMSPIKGIYAAVTRIPSDGSFPEGWYPQQRIKVEEALRAYTYGTASSLSDLVPHVESH